MKIILDIFLCKGVRANRSLKPLLFFFITILSLQSQAQNYNFVITPSVVNASAGSSFSVAVRMEWITGEVAGALAHVDFDNTKLEVTSISVAPGNLLPLPIGAAGTTLLPLATINEEGHFHYGSFTLSPPPTSSFDYLNVTFSVLPGAAAGPTSISFSTTAPHETEASFAGYGVLNALVNGTVNITASCTPPTATINASATCGGNNINLSLTAATGQAPYDLTINGTTYNNVNVGPAFTSLPLPQYSVFGPGDSPDDQDIDDGPAVTVGNKFIANQNGYLKGIRFYKGPDAAGQFDGILYDFDTQTQLARATFVTSASGWQEVLFSSPVYITAGQTYVAAVYSFQGFYSNTENGFSSAISNGPLTMPAGNGLDASSSNGLYIYADAFPPNSYFNSNYFVDVVFTPSSFNIELTSITADDGCVASGALQTLAISSIPCTLPVSLLNFSASQSGAGNISLKWSTSSEQNNKGFEIRRSLTGQGNWETIAFVNGAGESNTLKNYSYLDQNLPARRYYYQLNQIDFDGRNKLSSVVSANLGGKDAFGLEQNFPNPFRGQETTIRFTLPHRAQTQVIVYDMNGRVIKTLVNGVKEAGTHIIPFQDNTLPTGVYFYKLIADGFSDVKKMTIR